MVEQSFYLKNNYFGNVSEKKLFRKLLINFNLQLSNKYNYFIFIYVGLKFICNLLYHSIRNENFLI